MLLGLVCVAVVAGSGVLVVTRDKTGPEITISEDRKVSYEIGGDKKVLLDGVKATDEKDGDVSDSLMVEAVHENEDGSLEVTYSAVDHSNNVTKVTCKVETSGGESQEESQEESADLPEEGEENPEQQDGQEEQQPEENTESQEQQSEENSDTEAAIAALPEGSPQLRLSTHHVDLEVGASFQYMDYIENIVDDEDDTSTLYRQIRLVGEVDTSQPGEYEISYYVTDSNHNESNIEKLTVTVHE